MDRCLTTIVLVLGTLLLAGCPAGMPGASAPSAMNPILRATWTPVPLATWVAQEMPVDTEIAWEGFVGGPPMVGDFTRIVIDAGGRVSCTDNLGERWDGRISQDELRRIVLAFAEVNFFSLTSTDGCVYRADERPDERAVPTREVVTDEGHARITISINIKYGSVEHRQFCWGEGFPALEETITGVGCERFRAAQQATPTQ